MWGFVIKLTSLSLIPISPDPAFYSGDFSRRVDFGDSLGFFISQREVQLLCVGCCQMFLSPIIEDFPPMMILCHPLIPYFFPQFSPGLLYFPV